MKNNWIKPAIVGCLLAAGLLLVGWIEYTL
jgi:hypothetical protein